MILFSPFSKNKMSEKTEHGCCEGRGFGYCSYCMGDCNYCNNLDCEGKECGTCYVCHMTNPNNFPEIN